MSLHINHNLAALNAHRDPVNATNALEESMQRLSSGYRISRDADNPSGLVISEQFRARIAGLNRSTDSSEDSVRTVQTAEAFLTKPTKS